MKPEAVLVKALLMSLQKKNKHLHTVNHIRKHLRKRVSVSEAMDFFHKHKHKPVHINDLMLSTLQKSKLLNALEQKGKGMEGEGLFKWLGHVTKKGIRKLRDFIQGKTKFKPHHLTQIIGTGSDILKFGLEQMGDPRAQAAAKLLGVVSKGSKKGTQYLKKHGRGLELSGGGLYLSGQQKLHSRMPYGISYTGSGKIKRDRYSVFHGYYEKTPSGLTKDDFVLRGKKVLSKKKIEQGKRMKKSGKGIFA